MRRRHQQLPASGPAREALREKGQFWTPAWVASAMVRYVQPEKSGHLFDPAAGACAFFAACKAASKNGSVRFLGSDIDLSSLDEAVNHGLTRPELRGIEQRDFVLDPPIRKFRSIIANPPYIRHHRLPAETKQELRLIARSFIGKDLDGRAGFHVYFLIRALSLLEQDGRLSFIIPGDTFEGVFARTLWDWILSTYKLDAVITFSGDATPFPGVDTNAVIVCIRKAGPTSEFVWARCTDAETERLAAWVGRGFKGSFPGEVMKRTAEEGLRTGLSRPPAEEHTGPTLLDFATVVRGIATGDNDFFFFTSKQIDAARLDRSYFVRALGRTRDANSDRVTPADLKALDVEERPTFLLSLNKEALEDLPESLRQYLKSGQERQVDKRALIAMRKPWYRMERRAVPPLLFAYLGRRNSRFILNETEAVPLTAFLCIYPRTGVDASALWRALNDPRTLGGLKRVAKSYGSDAIKVEPRSLERLPIPSEVASQYGLSARPSEKNQMEIAFSI